MTSAPKAVFLSYASQDGEAARRICDALRAMSVEVWFDQSALRGGDAWDASIRRQIRECALFVPIISANTQAREEGYFRREWNLAVNRTMDMADGKAFLLPVVIDAIVDVNARVPEKFRDVQWTHLPGGRSSDVFAEHVHALLSGAASHATSSAANSRTPSPVAAAAREREPASIAVLPFVNRSRDEEDEYFSDGLADELLNVLAKIRGLRVAARTSSFQFKGRNDDIAVIGSKLNVKAVLEGSVRKAGNRMRISVQLVNVADGYHLWSETYDRTFDDIFAVQDDIAQSVVKELRAMLIGAADVKAAEEVKNQVAAAAQGRATDPEAHRLLLQARYLAQRNNRDDTAKAIGYLKEALDLDPEFALAWTELSNQYAGEAGNGWTPVTEGYGRAREAVVRALTLEPDLAEAHGQMGWIHANADWDWAAAEASCRRALDLAPGNARVMNLAAALAMSRGRLEEAVALYRQAIAQDPLRPVAYSNLAAALHAAGRFKEAEAAYSKALELGPQRSSLHALLAHTLLAQGRGEEALAEALRESEECARLLALAIIHHAGGHRAESDAALDALIDRYQDSAAYQVAQACSTRGETELAFQWLERAYRQRDPGLSDMKCDPALRGLRADPRWAVLLRRMGLAD